MVIGEVGTGKTTLCRQLLRRFSGDEKIETHLILDPSFSTPREFLRVVAEMLTQEKASETADDFELKEIIKQSLFQKGVDQDLTVVLIIDEGQKIPGVCLELLREFLNYETNAYKLLQIAIFAQKEFSDTLKAHANFADRINLLHHLEPMNFQDTRSMIQFRLNQSSGPQRVSLFTRPALWAIFRATEGYPRKIVNLCHRSILTMIIQNKSKAGWFLVRSCIKRVFDSGPARTWQYIVLVLLLLTGLSLYMPKWLPWLQNSPTAEENGSRTGQQIAFSGNVPEVSPSLVTLKEDSQEFPSSSSPNQKNPQVASIDPALLKDFEGSGEKLAEQSVEPVQKANIPMPLPEPPAVLGQLKIQHRETLGGVIQNIYGAFNPGYLKSVVKMNPHIINPDTIKIGEVILFPAIPAQVSRPATQHWFVEVKNTDTIEAAFTFLRKFSKMRRTFRLVPYWNQTSGLHFSILLGRYFLDKASALSKLNTLPNALKTGAKAVSGWNNHTVFYADPYKETDYRAGTTY